MKSTTKDITFIALSTTIMIICSFITIPFPIPFTLQTFALFTIIGLFGIKKALVSILLYLLIGAIGFPVFSGLRGGIGILFVVPGRSLLGFLFTAPISGLLLNLLSKNGKTTFPAYLLSMATGLFVCYGFGTLWYLLFYTNSTENISIVSVLSMCIFPFILPDFIKIAVSYYVVKLLKKHITKL